jgi:ATPase subunit of ABC transporter with duplicated ATPase domains
MAPVESIVATAQRLMASHNKRQLATLARTLAWRGDEARTPMLQIALYVATKQADATPPQSAQPAQPDQSQPDQSQPAQSQPAQSQPAQPDQSQPAQSQPDQSQPDQSQPAQSQPAQSQPAQPDQQARVHPLTNPEWRDALKRAGIDRPHPMLRKIFELLRQKQNVYLCGPDGCGKSTIARQCADLLGLRYGYVPCTAGMSESQLLGWRLPVDGGRFIYTPALYTVLYQSGGLFLLDEADAADANTILVLNGSLANGHLVETVKLFQSSTLAAEGGRR